MSILEKFIPFFLVYYLIISFVGVILTIYDKKIAGTGKWRIPEATLMLLGLFGAALPMYVVMKKIRHKTKHKKFMLGLPAEMILHIILVAIYFVVS